MIDDQRNWRSFARHPALWMLAAALLLVSAARFDGPSRGYWDTYITVPAMFMTGQPVDLQRIDGSPRFSYALQGSVPEDTFDPTPGSFGISSKDQRIGTAVLFAAPFALFNMAAFRWGFALSWSLLFVFSAVGIRRLIGGTWLPLAASLWLVLNPLSLYLDRLNGNLFGLVFLALLWALLDEERPRWWLLGLLYGVIGGIRNEAIVLAPLFLGFAIYKERSPVGTAKALALAVAAALLTITPVLLWNRFAYGQAIIHPSQVAHLEGWRPTFPHRWFGQVFEFNGLLNWPFHDRVIRTPHFAFPTALHWSLVTLKSLGLFLAPLAAVGVVQLLRRRTFHGAMLLFWYGVVSLLFVTQENWEELKQTFMALQLFPLAVFVAAGLRWLAEGLRSPARWAGVLAAGALLAGLAAGAGQLEIPADERWYVRFPHAGSNDSKLNGLPVALRKDWQFFYTHESPEEIEEERRTMTRVRPWPTLYRPPYVPEAGLLGRVTDEFGQRELSTLAIWSYIYE